MTIREKYEAGDYSLSELVKACSHWVSLFVVAVFFVVIGVCYFCHVVIVLVCHVVTKHSFRRNGTLAHFVRRNGIRRNGIRRNGMTPSRLVVEYKCRTSQ